MGYSYTTGRNRYGRMTNSDDSTHLSNGDDIINESINVILSICPWTFLEKSETVDTVDGQRSYEIPANLRQVLDDVYIEVSSNIYLPREIDDSTLWKQVLGRQAGESDVQEFWYRRGSKIELDPVPATDGNTIYFIGRKKFGRLQNADYSTGTVSINSGATTVTGVGTTFTEAMVGRYIRFDDGDNLLYEIASYTSATEIAIAKPYEGSANVSGSTYNIGEYSPLPDEYQAAPLYRAAAIYWQENGDMERSNRFWQTYDGGYEIGQTQTRGGMIGQMYDQYSRKSQGNYIAPIADSIGRDPNIPPTTIAQSNFT